MHCRQNLFAVAIQQIFTFQWHLPRLLIFFSPIFNANRRLEKGEQKLHSYDTNFARKRAVMMLQVVFRQRSCGKSKLTDNRRLTLWPVVDSPFYVTRMTKHVPQSRHAGDIKASEWLRISPGGMNMNIQTARLQMFPDWSDMRKTPAHSKQSLRISAQRKPQKGVTIKLAPEKITFSFNFKLEYSKRVSD